LTKKDLNEYDMNFTNDVWAKLIQQRRESHSRTPGRGHHIIVRNLHKKRVLSSTSLKKLARNGGVMTVRGTTYDERSEEDYIIVEKVLDARTTSLKSEYLVKWVGFPEDESTWEQSLDTIYVGALHFKKQNLKRAQNDTSPTRTSKRVKVQ
jgi:hypothetical protein